MRDVKTIVCVGVCVRLCLGDAFLLDMLWREGALDTKQTAAPAQLLASIAFHACAGSSFDMNMLRQSWPDHLTQAYPSSQSDLSTSCQVLGAKLRAYSARFQLPSHLEGLSDMLVKKVLHLGRGDCVADLAIATRQGERQTNMLPAVPCSFWSICLPDATACLRSPCVIRHEADKMTPAPTQELQAPHPLSPNPIPHPPAQTQASLSSLGTSSSSSSSSGA